MKSYIISLLKELIRFVLVWIGLISVSFVLVAILGVYLGDNSKTFMRVIAGVLSAILILMLGEFRAVRDKLKFVLNHKMIVSSISYFGLLIVVFCGFVPFEPCGLGGTHPNLRFWKNAAVITYLIFIILAGIFCFLERRKLTKKNILKSVVPTVLFYGLIILCIAVKANYNLQNKNDGTCLEFDDTSCPSDNDVNLN